MKKYYFPIQSSSLAHYFGSAIIKPAKYFTYKPHDIQDRYKDFLLLTTKLGTKETDCCLEIVLTNDEEKDLIDVNNGWFLYDVKPLAITRIRKIYFSDIEKKDTTITNIRMSTAYVPEELVEIRQFEINPSTSIIVPSDCKGVEQTESIIKFDRFLGALALMKTAGEPYMNYSLNYISTLAFFNSLIREQINKAYSSFTGNPYQGIFTNSKGFERILPYLNAQIDESILTKIASEEKQEIKKDKITRIIDIDSINDRTWTYTMAFLYLYGVGDESRRKRIDGLIQSHFSEIKREKAEGIALCYGYNRGYSAFTKDYGINEKVPYKYKLESQLDYYTIESVYQYVFNNTISSTFPYLDEWCPKLSVGQAKRRTDYVILDEIIIGKKKAKVFSEEWWNGFFPKFREFGRLANELFFFFKEICEEIKEDIEEEQEDIIASYKDIIDRNNKEINDLKYSLKRKEGELIEIQQQLRNSQSPIVGKSHESNSADLEKLTVPKLKELAKNKGICVPNSAKKKEIIALLLAQSNSLFN